MGVSDGDVVMHSDTGNTTYDTGSKHNEGSRQSAARAASVTQAQATAADIAYYRALLAQSNTLGANRANTLHALWLLGARDG